MNDVRDEIMNHPPGKRITQVGRVEFMEIMRDFMSGKLDFGALCFSGCKKERVLARKLLCITQMKPQESVALMVNKDWLRLEFTKIGADSVLIRQVAE